MSFESDPDIFACDAREELTLGDIALEIHLVVLHAWLTSPEIA